MGAFFPPASVEAVIEDREPLKDTHGSLTPLGRLFVDPFELVGGRQELRAFERSLVC